DVHIVLSTLTGNQANQDTTAAPAAGAVGGAIYASGTHVNISFSTLSGNKAYDGGALYSNSVSDVTIYSSTIAVNVASHNGGGIYFNFGTGGSIVNSTIGQNKAANQGGG